MCTATFNLFAIAGRNNGPSIGEPSVGKPTAVRKIAMRQATAFAGSGQSALIGCVLFLTAFSALIFAGAIFKSGQSANCLDSMGLVGSLGVVGGLLCSLCLLCVIILLVLLTGDASY